MLDQLESPVVAQDDSQTMSENVFRRIQAAIVKGEIAPGSKISEPELARTYGISRGPLREAIHRLEGQRLLVRVPHVGARVVSLSHAELIELYEIRESLEGWRPAWPPAWPRLPWPGEPLPPSELSEVLNRPNPLPATIATISLTPPTPRNRPAVQDNSAVRTRSKSALCQCLCVEFGDCLGRVGIFLFRPEIAQFPMTASPRQGNNPAHCHPCPREGLIDEH